MSDETLSSFKNSFSYGPRSDLSFKFLKGLTADEAAQFFQELLAKLGDAIDDDDFRAVRSHTIATQRQVYALPGKWTYDEAPFTPLPRPVARLRLQLLTSSGHFVAGEDPRPFGMENMTQQEAMAQIMTFLKHPPRLSAIPLDTPPEALRVRHGGYDIRGALKDPGVAFPLVGLRELVQSGAVGALVDPAYSFVGAAAQRPLLKNVLPGWVERFREAGAEGALLVPL